MFKLSQTRDSARAGLFAALTGSAVGLIFAAGYLGAGLPHAQAAEDAPVPGVEVAEAAPAAEADAPQTAVTAPDSPVRAHTVRASLVGPAARPFDAKHGQTDLECLTQAVYYEARGEGRAGQAAVAQVVLNRVRHPYFPRSVCAVVFQDCQFSFACDGSMNARRNARAWDRARKIAAEALSGAVMARVGNATHFHTTNVSPNWGPSLVRVGRVGLHIFYRFAGRNGASAAFTEEAVPSTAAPGLYEYRRLTPEERVYMTSAVLKKPETALAQSESMGVGGPLGPVEEPASAPEMNPKAPITTAPKPAPVKAAAAMASAQTPVSTAS